MPKLFVEGVRYYRYKVTCKVAGKAKSFVIQSPGMPWVLREAATEALGRFGNAVENNSLIVDRI